MEILLGGGGELLMPPVSHQSGFSLDVSDSFIQYAVCSHVITIQPSLKVIYLQKQN